MLSLVLRNTLSGKQDSTGLCTCRKRWDVPCRGFLLTGGGWCLELVRAYPPSVAGSEVNFKRGLLTRDSLSHGSGSPPRCVFMAFNSVLTTCPEVIASVVSF